MSVGETPVGRAVATPEEEAHADALTRTWLPPRGFAALSAVNQTPIGIRYIVTAFAFFLIGGILALLMRTQLAVPQNGFLEYDTYNQLFTMHGTTMMFLFAVPMVEGAAIALIPQMIGSRDMSFPRLSAFGYWCFLFGGVLLYSSLVLGMMPDAGWFLYPPLSGAEFSPGKGVDFWLLSITLVEIGGVTAALEIAVTILRNRAPGMSLDRMPLFAWYMLVVSFMVLLAFPPLILGDVLLEIERSFEWPFFDPELGGHPLLWQHLFWIFGHPEVYIIFLPAAGAVSMMIATFSQRPTVGHAWLVIAAVGTGVVSMGLWVHHMFATGIPLISLSAFSAASMTVSIFSGIQVFAWLATLWLGRPVFTTPMLFVIGFLFLFVAGGLTGVMHAVVPFDWQTHSSYFLVAHFHYVLIGGMVFPLFGAIYYWFPNITGRMMSETAGKWNFWLMFIGVNVAFFPMHISGMMGMPRRVYTYPEGFWEWENLTSTIGAYLIAASVLLFLFNFFRSLVSGAPAGMNPWNGGTLEWTTHLPAPAYNFRSIPRVESRYPVWDQPEITEKIERGEYLLARAERGLRIGLTSSTVTGELENAVVHPKPSFAPLIAAFGLALAMVGLLLEAYLFAAAGGAVFALAALAWAWAQPTPSDDERDLLARRLEMPVGSDAPGAFGWWGTWVGIVSAAALFVSLVFAHFYLWTVSPQLFQAGGLAVEPILPALGAVALLVGSIMIFLAGRLLHRTPLVVIGLLLGLVIGVGYAALQVWILLQSDLSPQEHAYAALIYTLTGFNLLHIGIAVVMLGFGVAWALLRPPGLARSLVVRNTGLFWHYTVVVSLVTNAVLHLWPMAAV